jgi:hypothetical protein
MTTTQTQQDQASRSSEKASSSQPDGQCPPPADWSATLREIVDIQRQRLTAEHLCRVAVEHDDLGAARWHARRAAELDRRHRDLAALLYDADGVELRER